MNNKYWLARNKYGTLLLFNEEPRSEDGKWYSKEITSGSPVMLPEVLFPNVTFETSPVIIGLLDKQTL